MARHSRFARTCSSRLTRCSKSDSSFASKGPAEGSSMPERTNSLLGSLHTIDLCGSGVEGWLRLRPDGSFQTVSMSLRRQS